MPCVLCIDDSLGKVGTVCMGLNMFGIGNHDSVCFRHGIVLMLFVSVYLFKHCRLLSHLKE